MSDIDTKQESPPAQKRLLLVGGNLICGTIAKRNLIPEEMLAGVLPGCSPFSLACTAGERPDANPADNRAVDGENGLRAYLQAHPATHVAVDLHYCLNTLISLKDSYYTSALACDAVKKAGKAVNPRDIPEGKRKALMEAFAKLLLERFPQENIALVRTVKSQYYVAGNRVRPQEAEEFNSFIRKCEEEFLETAQCKQVETLQFYYLVQQPKGMQYEEEAYLDTADNLRRFVRGDHIRRRPIFQYSLNRYCKYYNNVYKAAFMTFLRTDNAVENLVYSSEPWFVRKYYEHLREIEKLLKMNYADTAGAMDKDKPEMRLLADIFLAMDGAAKKDWVNPELRYDLLFENRITCRSLHSEVRKYAKEHWQEIWPEQITEVNYGYYFSLMQMELSANAEICKKALAAMRRLQNDPQVVLKPLVLDVWGSCVSRLNFQYDNTAHRYDIVYRANIFQGLPIFLDGPKVTYDEAIFAPPLAFDDTIVKQQLDGTICQTLDATGTPWVVLDFYSLTALTVNDYQGRIFCDNQGVMCKKLGAKRVNLQERFTVEEIYRELDKLAAYLKKRYGNNIILIKHKRMESYVDIWDKIHDAADKERMDSIEKNPFNDRYTKYFAEVSGCYFIDIIDQFLADENNLLYLKTVHYEDAFYEECIKLIRHIVTQSPAQRHFTDYGNDTRVARILRLGANNPQHPVFSQIFGQKWLDTYLLNMKPDILKKYAQVYALLYDENFSSLKEAAEGFCWKGREDALRQLVIGNGEETDAFFKRYY